MRLFRGLALVLVCLGLVTQGPAYAAAERTAPAAASAECADMSMPGPAPAHERQKGCCDDMRSCVLGMNCMTPLVAPEAIVDASPRFASDVLYGSVAAVALSAAARGPEPPPPQL